MKIKITHKMWEEAGKQQGWIKKSQEMSDYYPHPTRDTSVFESPNTKQAIHNIIMRTVLSQIIDNMGGDLSGSRSSGFMMGLEEKVGELAGWIESNMELTANKKNDIINES